MMMIYTMTKMITNHYYQPSGNLCGPTCIFMVYQLKKSKSNKTMVTQSMANALIEEIGDICGTDWVVGTPPERMVNGMGYLGLRFIEFQSSPRPYVLLKEVLDNESFAIVRTITRGVPHWIVVIGYNDLGYDIFDPWLGPIHYTESELDLVWSPREYQFYQI